MNRAESWSGKMYTSPDYYAILGVKRDVSQDDLKKAYEAAAIRNNPYAGGDSEKLMEIFRAYMVLRNPQKRKIYDHYTSPTTKRDIVRSLPVSLQDLYNGRSIKRNFTRSVICAMCNGKGSKSGASVKCSCCGGLGETLYLRDPTPPPLLLPHPCYRCKATGETVSETVTAEDLCEQCKGEKIVQQNKVVEVHVEKGMQNGQRITMPKDTIDTHKGDIVFIIEQEEEHPIFTRKGDDLYVEHTLTLVEALSGFQFVLTHLDERQLTIKSQPGEIVKPGQVKEINDEGMPVYQRPSMRGKLYIHFKVEFPDSLPPGQFKAIQAFISPGPSLHKKVDDERRETGAQLADA